MRSSLKVALLALMPLQFMWLVLTAPSLFIIVSLTSVSMPARQIKFVLVNLAYTLKGMR
jgi:hypothetical protein